jgi:hypothetical protein
MGFQLGFDLTASRIATLGLTLFLGHGTCLRKVGSGACWNFTRSFTPFAYGLLG